MPVPGMCFSWLARGEMQEWPVAWLFWRQKFVAVEVDHVGGQFRNPDLCFPCDFIREFFESRKIQKGCDINPACGAMFEEFLHFHLAFWRNWAMGCYRFDQQKAILPFIVQQNISQLAVFRNRHMKFRK